MKKEMALSLIGALAMGCSAGLNEELVGTWINQTEESIYLGESVSLVCESTKQTVTFMEQGSFVWEIDVTEPGLDSCNQGQDRQVLTEITGHYYPWGLEGEDPQGGANISYVVTRVEEIIYVGGEENRFDEDESTQEWVGLYALGESQQSRYLVLDGLVFHPVQN